MGDIYDVMLEVPGIFRSGNARIRLDHEVEPGEILDLDGRRSRVTDVHPAHSLRVDRRVVAQEIVKRVASAA
jgi:hypothetical protein